MMPIRFDTLKLVKTLRSSGMSEEQAEAIANYETRFNKIDLQLHLLKWMVGFNLAFTMAIVYKLFFA